MCVTIVLMLAYDSVKPIHSVSNNFIPFLETFPDLDELKYPNCKRLTRCDSSGGCGSCGSMSNTDSNSNFTCSTVNEDEKVFFNGAKVPPGRWCLPRGKERVQCGIHTGRAVWSESKGWECVCLYPDLFGGKNCNTVLACKSPRAPNNRQINNVLSNKNTGEIWDPLNPPAGNSTPYDTDSEGNPLYICRCDSTGVKKFVNLPGDPYRCHLEPCSDEHEIPFFNMNIRKCDCTAGGLVNNEYAYSNVTNKCVRTPQCAWNDKKNMCMCPEGQVAQTCNSLTMARIDNTAPDCPAIPGGSFCNNPCEGYCLNDGIGRIEGTKCTCTCPEHPDIEFHGDRCDDACMKDGVTNPTKRCCSGIKHRKFAGRGPYTTAYYKCGSSCFLGDAKVTMADMSEKEIKHINAGDELLSAHNTKTTALFVDKVVLGERKVIGTNGIWPFVTEDHCFFGENGDRQAVNCYLAHALKHWECVKPYTGNITINSHLHPNTPVFDVITDTHTLVVNGIKFYDDMPEVDKHPEVAVACALVGQKSLSVLTNDDSVDSFANNLFEMYSNKVICYIRTHMDLLPVLFNTNMKWFLDMANRNKKCLHVCSSLWKYKFHDFKNEINKRLQPIKIMLQIGTRNVYLYLPPDEEGMDKFNGVYESNLKRWKFPLEKKNEIKKFVEDTYPEVFDSDIAESDFSDDSDDDDNETDRRFHRAKSFSGYDSDEDDRRKRSRSRSRKFKEGYERYRPQLTNHQFSKKRNNIKKKI